MGLSSELAKEFAKATDDTVKEKSEKTVTGTIVVYDGKYYVRIDGSDRLTPYESTAGVKEGDRVTVTIKDHNATVTGNLSSPSATESDVKDVNDKVNGVQEKVTEFYSIVSDKASIEELEAAQARIDDLEAEDARIKGTLEATQADIGELKADNAEIEGRLTAAEADVDHLEADKLDADVADLKYAQVEDLNATNAYVNNLEAAYGEFKDLTTKYFDATNASIEQLEATKLSAEQADLKYADIDFTNINWAAVKKIFAESGIIKDLIVSEGKITGELVGVTIKGDIIEGNTIIADKLVIRGEDGLFYKLNVDSLGAEVAASDEKYQNGLDGSNIIAKSIVADKIAVDDLVAFGATIGGFHISDHALFSAAKDGINNTTAGLYLGADGQMYIGDASNYVRFYQAKESGEWKLDITANELRFGSGGKTIEEALEEVEKMPGPAGRDGADAILLQIVSSNGNMFKNNTVSTTLTVEIIVAGIRITSSRDMYTYFGKNAKLEWQQKKFGEKEFAPIDAADPRLSDNGFIFTISSEDVQLQTIYTCALDY